MRCSALQRVVVFCGVLQCVAVCCSMLQCLTVSCNVLQCVAVCCKMLQSQATWSWDARPVLRFRANRDGLDWRCWLELARGSAKRCVLRKIFSFWTPKVNKTPMIRADRSNHDLSATWRYTPRRIEGAFWQGPRKPFHHTSVSGYAQLRGDQINIQRVRCLCPLYLALSTALVIVWAVISEHDGERLVTMCRLPSYS